MKAEDQSAEREALPPKWLADAKRRIAAAHFAVGSDMHLLEMAVIDYEEARAALSAREAPAREQRLWLWQNFVDGRPEYWAFDNPYPCVTVWGDPLTLGEPCGYAIFKESVNGRPNRPEAEVIATVTRMHAADPAPPAAKAVEMDADDTKRLDWLQANCAGASDSERYLPFRIWWGKPHAGNNKTLRSAIDAAMGGNHG